MLGTDLAFWFSTQDTKTKLVFLAVMLSTIAICGLICWLQDERKKNKKKNII
jgi:hypothetical protein